MAKFKLINVKLMKVTKEGDNFNKEYLVADLLNLNCPWEQAQRYTSFNEGIVAMCKPVIAVADGGESPNPTKLPTELEIIQGCFAEYTPAQKFYKEHLSDHAAQGIKAGDLVKKGGIPVLYTTLSVFCQYYTDENGKTAFMRGSSPTEAGQRAFSAYCRPTTEEAVTNIDETTKIDHEETALEAAKRLGMPEAPVGFTYKFDANKQPNLAPL